MGVNGFLISWAMMRAISAHAASRLDRTRSDTSSITAMRVPAPPSGSGTVTTRQRSPARGSSSSDTSSGLARSSACRTPSIASPGKTASRVRPSESPPPEHRGGRIGEDHSPVFPVRDDARRQPGQQRREALLLAGQGLGLLLQAARHEEKRAHELAQLFVRRLGQVRREVPAGDRARALDEIRHGPGHAHGEAARDRGRDEEDEEAERGDGRRQLARLGLGDALLRQQQEREQHGAADARHAGNRGQLRRDLLEAAARDQPRVGALARRAQADRHVGGPRDPFGQEAGREQIAARRGHELGLRRVDRQVVADGVGQPREQRVVEQPEAARGRRRPRAGNRPARAARFRARFARGRSSRGGSASRWRNGERTSAPRAAPSPRARRGPPAARGTSGCRGARAGAGDGRSSRAATRRRASPRGRGRRPARAAASRREAAAGSRARGSRRAGTRRCSGRTSPRSSSPRKRSRTACGRPEMRAFSSSPAGSSGPSSRREPSDP